MKKSKYIGKYDYIGYYTKPEGLWFFYNYEIEAAIKTELKSYINLKEFYEDDEEDLWIEETEFDSYDFYLQQKEELKQIDENNPLIIEGRIIDQKSKEFIIREYADIKKVIDFESNKWKKFNNEKIAEITKEKILDNNQYILFQPIFIHDNKITKPDAIVKLNNEKIILIETKGTTSCKFVHFLDVYFQKQVIENQSWLQDWTFEYKLCLVKYEFLNKEDISFETTNHINCSKSVSTSQVDANYKKYSNEAINIKNKIKKGYDEKPWSNLDSYPIDINKIMNLNLNIFDEIIETCKNAQKRKSAKKSKDIISNLINSFDEIVTKLQNHKNSMNQNSLPNFLPSVNDKNPFKDCDFFPQERKIYAMKGYNLYKYSGKVANFDRETIQNTFINAPLDTFIKKPKKNPFIYENLFKETKTYLVEKNKANFLLERIKKNKIYFDFETINTAIRSMDKTLPFAQIITQCSILKNFGNQKNKCINLIIDPKKINAQWYMDVIDQLYEKKKNISYIVYNKSFESSRLKEISYFLNNEEYTKKIFHIINNIFDLADFFQISSSNGYCIFFKELYGFYSIKKILPLIKKYSQDIFVKTKCLDYENLDIGNGQDCQSKTILRFFNKISDKNWTEISKQMQIYCENDVRAMVAVEMFIQDLVNEKIKI